MTDTSDAPSHPKEKVTIYLDNGCDDITDIKILAEEVWAFVKCLKYVASEDSLSRVAIKHPRTEWCKLVRPDLRAQYEIVKLTDEDLLQNGIWVDLSNIQGGD